MTSWSPEGFHLAKALPFTLAGTVSDEGWGELLLWGRQVMSSAFVAATSVAVAAVVI